VAALANPRIQTEPMKIAPSRLRAAAATWHWCRSLFLSRRPLLAGIAIAE